MKKLLQTLAIMAMILSPMAISNSAHATSTCPIGFTGPDSENICVSENSYTCEADIDNHIDIFGDNHQTVISGQALNADNTWSGSAESGLADNNSIVDFKVTVLEGKPCSVLATTSPIIKKEEVVKPGKGAVTPTKTTPTQPQGGQGAVQPPVSTLPAVLANTASDSSTKYLAIAASVLGAGALASYLGVALYRRMRV